MQVGQNFATGCYRRVDDGRCRRIASGSKITGATLSRFPLFAVDKVTSPHAYREREATQVAGYNNRCNQVARARQLSFEGGGGLRG